MRCERSLRFARAYVRVHFSSFIWCERGYKLCASHFTPLSFFTLLWLLVDVTVHAVCRETCAAHTTLIEFVACLLRRRQNRVFWPQMKFAETRAAISPAPWIPRRRHRDGDRWFRCANLILMRWLQHSSISSHAIEKLTTNLTWQFSRYLVLISCHQNFLSSLLAACKVTWRRNR